MEFKNLSKDSQVIYLLSLSELALGRLYISIDKEIAKKVIEAGWEWLINKVTEADALYYLLENMDETGIINYMLLKDFNTENVDIFRCITNAFAYTIFIAYDYEGAEFLPQTIESVDYETIDDFICNFNKFYGQPSLVNELAKYLSTIEEFCICEKIKKVKKYINEFK